MNVSTWQIGAVKNSFIIPVKWLTSVGIADPRCFSFGGHFTRPSGGQVVQQGAAWRFKIPGLRAENR
jgi:hypothetical protein